MVYETVTDLNQLLDRIKSYHADADLDLVRKAYEFSAKAHVGQLRLSGEPYVQHPIAVAGVLSSLKTDVTAIVATVSSRVSCSSAATMAVTSVLSEVKTPATAMGC